MRFVWTINRHVGCKKNNNTELWKAGEKYLPLWSKARIHRDRKAVLWVCRHGNICSTHPTLKQFHIQFCVKFFTDSSHDLIPAFKCHQVVLNVDFNQTESSWSMLNKCWLTEWQKFNRLLKSQLAHLHTDFLCRIYSDSRVDSSFSALFSVSHANISPEPKSNVSMTDRNS